MDAMGWLAWIILGGVVGALASVDKQSRIEILSDIAVGIIGAFIGGYLFRLIGAVGTTAFNLWSVLVAFVGAVGLLGLLRLIRGSVGPRTGDSSCIST